MPLDISKVGVLTKLSDIKPGEAFILLTQQQLLSQQLEDELRCEPKIRILAPEYPGVMYLDVRTGVRYQRYDNPTVLLADLFTFIAYGV